MSKAEDRRKEVLQAALDYANNLYDVKPADCFSRNLCIALGKAFMKGAEWADKSMADKAIEVEIVGLKKQILDGSCGYFEIEGNYKEGDKLKIIVIKEE